VEEAMLVAEAAETENEAIVIAAENRLTCELLSQDLKALVEDNWDWRIHRISDTDFSVICPTKASLTLCKNLCRTAGGIPLPVSKVSVLFADPAPHLRASSVLAKVWVQLLDVPSCLRHVDLLLEGTKMLGRPRIVDEESLATKDGPVRMLFHSQAPNRLPKSVMLFANLQGFRIRVAAEFAKGEGPKAVEPMDKSKEDGDDESTKEQTEDQSQSDCHWKRGKGKDTEKAKDTGALGSRLPGSVRVLDQLATPPPVPAEPTAEMCKQQLNVYKKNLFKKLGTKSSVGSSSVPAPSAKDHSATKPASAPAKFKIQPIPFNQYGSNLEEDFLAVPILQPHAISMTIILDEDSPPSSSDAPIDSMILKRSKLSATDRADIGWESPEDWEYDNETLAAKIAKLKKKQDGEVDNPPSTPCKPDLVGEVAASVRVAKAKRSAAVVSPISGSRTSARGKGMESEPILQKAIKRTATKAGTDSPSPMKPKFDAFSSTPELFFLGLAKECGLSLGDSSISPSAVLLVIRAREIA
jgi:hypothetical protein